MVDLALVPTAPTSLQESQDSLNGDGDATTTRFCWKVSNVDMHTMDELP